MKIEISGDALKLFYDFLKYGKINRDKVADAMNYDRDGFSIRLLRLEKAYDKARGE